MLFHLTPRSTLNWRWGSIFKVEEKKEKNPYFKITFYLVKTSSSKLFFLVYGPNLIFSLGISLKRKVMSNLSGQTQSLNLQVWTTSVHVFLASDKTMFSLGAKSCGLDWDITQNRLAGKYNHHALVCSHTHKNTNSINFSA